MEVIQQQQQQQQRKPESLYGSTGEIQVEDVNMTTRNRSPDCAYYEPCPNTEFEFYGENKSKSRPSTKWWNDNEVKRKRRVAKYKLYAVEGKDVIYGFYFISWTHISMDMGHAHLFYFDTEMLSTISLQSFLLSSLEQ
ncbi:hypothetical protein VNO77_13691 [Canavalia gladiata]|uniref:Uncharacterized protein n=1 Tax=Canavalia gladiata TaxID=3824 RepID=A0AAN9LXI8_CANGL